MNKRAKTLQPPEDKKPVDVAKQVKDAETLNEVAKKVNETDPYTNESAKKADKNDMLRDVSSLSSMDNANPNDNKVSSGTTIIDEEKEKETKEIKSNVYPNNNNYPRKLSKSQRDKKNSAATKSIEDQKLVIRKDFIENRQSQLHNQLLNKNESQPTKKEVREVS